MLIIGCTACGSGLVDSSDSVDSTDSTDAAGTMKDVLYSGTCGDDLTWEIRVSTLTISGTGEMDDYNNFTAPWNETSEMRNSITSVVIEEGVLTIGSAAFYGMSTITDVTMSDSVAAIGSYAFDSCSALVNLQLSRNLAYIYNCAFEKCDSLTEVSLPAIVKISYDAFYACTSISFLYLGDGLQFIGEDAFQYNNIEMTYCSGSEEEWNALERLCQ